MAVLLNFAQDKPLPNPDAMRRESARTIGITPRPVKPGEYAADEAFNCESILSAKISDL